jgi:hypothetical protein
MTITAGTTFDGGHRLHGFFGVRFRLALRLMGPKRSGVCR